MRYCKYCGSETKENQKFCKSCGKEILVNQVMDTGEYKNKENKVQIEENYENEMEIKESKEDNEDIIQIEENRELDHKIEVPIEKNKEENYKTKVQIEENNYGNYKSWTQVDENKNYLNDKDKDKKKNLKIIIPVVALICICLVGGYFAKDIVLSKYYESKITKVTSIEEKIALYDKLIGCKENTSLNNEILEILKTDTYNLKYLDKMNNLNEEDKNKIKIEIFIYNAEESYKKEDFNDAMEYLGQASNYGYDIKSNNIFKELEKKNQENKKDNNYTLDIFENDLNSPNKDEAVNTGDLYDKYSYIIEDSYCRYLTDEELKKYNKDTLALIRNEIYARHGYIFQTEPFKSYFNSKEWYIKDSRFKGADSELNDYELKNIYLIKRLEGN